MAQNNNSPDMTKLFLFHVFVETIKLGFSLWSVFEWWFSEVKKHWMVEELTRVYLYDYINFDEASMLFIPFCWSNLLEYVKMHIKDKLVVNYDSLQIFLFKAIISI